MSAIGTAFTLRSANIVSVVLLFLWTLSPLGGQSSLRLLHEANATVTEIGTVYYSDPAAVMDFGEMSTWFTLIPTVLGAGLAVSEDVKNRPVDLWSHPKIPRLDEIERNAQNTVNREGEWIAVNASSNVTYSSWVGINVQGLRPDKQTTMQVKTNYMYLDCEKLYGGTPAAVVDYLQNPNISFYPTLNTEGPESDYTDVNDRYLLFRALVMNMPSPIIQDFSFFLRAAWNSTDSGRAKNQSTPSTLFQNQPITYLYGASYATGVEDEQQVIYIHTCTPHVVFMEAQVDCQADACEVVQVRNVPDEPASKCTSTSGYILDCLTQGSYMVQMFLRFFPTVVSAGYSSGALNPFDDWIAGSNKTYRTNPTDSDRTIGNIPDKRISDRLTALLNTYWQAGSWGTQVTGADLFSKPEYPWNGSSTAPERFMNTTQAVFSERIPVYKADVGWIISLILITTVLLLLGVVNVVVSFWTIAPDLFYYASSLARENPYTNIPDGGTALDGGERSRLLRNLKVQIADVSPEQEVGYIVVKSAESNEDFSTGRLKKGRAYW